MNNAQFVRQYDGSSRAQFVAQHIDTSLVTTGRADDFDGAIGSVGTIVGASTLTPTVPLLENDQSDISGWAQIYVRVDGVLGKTPDFTIDFTGFRGGGSPESTWAPAWRYIDDTDPGTGKPRPWSKLGSSSTSPFTPDSAFTEDAIEICVRPRFRYLDTVHTMTYLAGTTYAVELPSSIAASSLPTHVIAEQTAQNAPNSTPDTVLNQYAIGFDDTTSQPPGGADKLNVVVIIGQHATEDASRYTGWQLVHLYAEGVGTDADWFRQYCRLFVYDGGATGVFAGRERFDSDDGTANDPNRAWDDTNSPTINEIKSALAADVSRVDLFIDYHNYGNWFFPGKASEFVGGFSASGTSFTNFRTRMSTAIGDTFVNLGTSSTPGTAAWYGDGTLSAQLSLTIEFVSGKNAGYPDPDAEFGYITDGIPVALKAMVDNSELTLSPGSTDYVMRLLLSASWTQGVPYILESGSWVKAVPYALISGSWVQPNDTN